MCVCLTLTPQVRGHVPGLGVCVRFAVLRFRRTAAPFVLTPEGSEFGAPVFPPLEGQGGAVRHQAALLRAPAPLAVLCADQEERPAHVEGGAAARQVPVGDPERLGAPADPGGGARAKDDLHRNGELPPGTRALHPLHLHLQHYEANTNCSQLNGFFIFRIYFIENQNKTTDRNP